MAEVFATRHDLLLRSVKFAALKSYKVVNVLQPHKEDKFLLMCGIRIKKMKKEHP